MKTATTILLFLSLLLPAQAPSGPKLPGGYFSLGVGAGPMVEDEGVLFGGHLSSGYQLKKWLGLGLCLGGHFGLEYASTEMWPASGFLLTLGLNFN